MFGQIVLSGTKQKRTTKASRSSSLLKGLGKRECVGVCPELRGVRWRGWIQGPLSEGPEFLGESTHAAERGEDWAEGIVAKVQARARQYS